jgi:hypothetical protein
MHESQVPFGGTAVFGLCDDIGDVPISTAHRKQMDQSPTQSNLVVAQSMLVETDRPPIRPNLADNIRQGVPKPGSGWRPTSSVTGRDAAGAFDYSQ